MALLTDRLFYIVIFIILFIVYIVYCLLHYYIGYYVVISFWYLIPMNKTLGLHHMVTKPACNTLKNIAQILLQFQLELPHGIFPKQSFLETICVMLF